MPAARFTRQPFYPNRPCDKFAGFPHRSLGVGDATLPAPAPSRRNTDHEPAMRRSALVSSRTGGARSLDRLLHPRFEFTETGAVLSRFSPVGHEDVRIGPGG